MTQANPPVIVRVNAGKATFMGVLYGLMILLFGLPFMLMALVGAPFGSWMGMAVMIVAVFGLLATLNLGLALRKPVALRMDETGISGWYSAPATWAEIAQISVLDGSKGAKLLAFALHDPIAFRDRQSPWQRLTSAMNGRSNGHHIVISEMLLDGMRAADLLPLAHTRHAAACPKP